MQITIRGIAMSTVAYITAMTIGIAAIFVAKAAADFQVHEPMSTPVVVHPLDKFRGATSLTDSELVEMLSVVGFKGQALKTAWAVAMRESRGHPTSRNNNISTGDNSYGLFQINMIDDLGESRLSKFASFGVTKRADLFDPVINAQIVYYMTDGGTNWGSWGYGPNAYDGTAEEAGITLWLHRFPTPVKA